jgi:hypothetical protein
MNDKNRKIKTGIAILTFSLLMTPAIILTAFLRLDAKTKVEITTTLIIIGNVTFYGGGFLVGKELFTRYKAYLNPCNWFKKKIIDK